MYSVAAVSLAILPFASAQVFVSKSTDSAVVASALSSISSLEALLQPPPSIASELTGIPPSVTSALTNPTLLSALQSQFESTLPSWYTALPSGAQAYIASAGSVAQSISPEILSLEQVAGIIVISGSSETLSGSATTTAGGSSSQPGGLMSTASSAGGSSTTQPGGPLKSTSSGTGSSKSSTATGTATAASSSSSAGAAPTGAIAAGLLGAVGVLGIAIAL